MTLHRAATTRPEGGLGGATATCETCRRPAPRLFTARDWNRRVSSEEFAYYRCDTCRSVFLDPVPEDLGAYYPSDYYSIPANHAEIARAAEMERYKIEIVRRFARDGRLLEIGPAYGSFLYLALQAGFAAEAVEMDHACCTFIRDVVGAKVVESADPVRALGQLPPFRVIALWHVVEHLPDPWAVLAAAAEALEAGGHLVLAAPNPDSLQFQVQGRFWPHVDAPRHVRFLPSALLVERLRALSLTAVWQTTDDPGARGWNTFGWQLLLMNLARRPLAREALRLLGSGLAALFSPLEQRRGRGSAYTIVFRKGPIA